MYRMYIVGKNILGRVEVSEQIDLSLSISKAIFQKTVK